jgi:hypothetical protein
MTMINKLRLSYHKKMRSFYEKDTFLQNHMKVIYHDLKIQRLEGVSK